MLILSFSIQSMVVFLNAKYCIRSACYSLDMGTKLRNRSKQVEFGFFWIFQFPIPIHIYSYLNALKWRFEQWWKLGIYAVAECLIYNSLPWILDSVQSDNHEAHQSPHMVKWSWIMWQFLLVMSLNMTCWRYARKFPCHQRTQKSVKSNFQRLIYKVRVLWICRFKVANVVHKTPIHQSLSTRPEFISICVLDFSYVLFSAFLILED